MHKEAKLVLEDGREFSGFSFGADLNTSGEVVFNTGMVGYPETFTDPSYKGQILTCTYPLIGNYGVPGEERENGILKYFESDHIQIKALIVSEYCAQYSHWNAKSSLQEWLVANKIPAIFGVDTRALTQELRDHGSSLGKIIINKEKQDFYDPNKENLSDQTSVSEPVQHGNFRKKIVLVDCGTKNNIIRSLLARKISVIQVPWDYDFCNIKADGILLSNGPGDARYLKETINHTKKAIDANMPILGICLGSQILGLAAGAKLYKLKYGHRGQNQPVINLDNKKCYITSQNHGFALETKTICGNWQAWFSNANDGTCEGLRHKKKPFMAVQFHPEASPGPDDTEFIFDEFIEMI